MKETFAFCAGATGLPGAAGQSATIGTTAAVILQVPLHHRLARVVLSALVAAVGVSAAAPAARQTGPADAARVDAQVRALGASAAETQAVLRLYRARAFAPAWTAADGTSSAGAQAVRVRLGEAGRQGLEPAAYLTPAVVAALATPRVTDEARLAGDVALTLATLRYMRHLHLGRVDPRSLGLRLEAWDEPHDFAAVLGEALAAGRVPAALDGLAPPFAVYQALVEALDRYRTLAAEPLAAMPAVSQTLREGDSFTGLAAVAARLAAFGDLPLTAVPPADTTTYAGPLVTAVRRFQLRHGLAVDGALGERTAAALAVPVATRADQIALALERLRWLPDLGTRPVILVNIPMFRLWAWDAGALARPPARSMEVIVGRAMRTETPVFVATMDHVIFRPYWNVPASMVRGEVLPALARDPRYLESQQMEIVRGGGDDAAVVPADEATIAALAAGTLRLRQRPGPHNALGLVKFVVPNRDNIYLHDTPREELFARARRDFSHGCIRVADPPALAAWTLAGRAGWTPARIVEAMAASRPEHVDLAGLVDVVLFYVTASVDPEDGTLRFADDIYGHDAVLARALAARR